MKIFASTLTFLAVIFLSCQKEVTEKLNGPNDVISQENKKLAAAITSQKQKTYLNGYIVNEQGQPVAGANISCSDKIAITDSKGFFYFKEMLNVNKDYALITVSKTGYRKGFRTFTPNRSKITYHTEKIMLQVDGIAQSVPSTGGTVTADGIKLTFPANSVVKAGGFAYSGDVKVMIRYINPAAANFPLLVPGMLSGLNSSGEIKALQSFGMANVELTDGAGRKLEIASGKTVKMEMPAPANGPATIPLWHFNESYGIWVQQGVASKVGNVYEAEVNHFSIWNIDLEFNDFELNLKFQTSPTSPIANLRVDVYRPNNVFLNTFFTDNTGEATLINCSSNEALILKMVFACDTITYNLAPVTQTRTEVITLSGVGIQTYNLTGTLLACNNQPIANQAFQVFLTGPGNFITLNGVSGTQGQINISTVFPNCQTPANLNAQTTAYLNNLYYISNTSTIVPGINMYNPKLCDTLGSGGGIYNDSDIVNIPDPNLLLKVRQAINKPSGIIYYIDVKNLDELDAPSSSIQSLIGLQYFTGLDSLYLAANSISDLAPLQNLTNLQELVVEQNNISNISPLQSMTGLKWLYLGDNQISNVAPLFNLTSLRGLGLQGCQISGIGFLQNFTLLQNLYLDNNNISNLTPLQNLTSISHLSLSYNQISNITPLQNLTALKFLYLDSNQISNITPLQNFTALQQLSLSSNQILNITPLQNLSNLIILFLYSNQITTIAPLISGVPALSALYILGGNQIPANEITAFQGTHPSCSVQ